MTLTSPSTTSTPALYLSNWQDVVGIWKAAKLSQIDPTVAGPRLGELHYLRGSQAAREVNQIVDYSGFFRDESSNTNYTHAENFGSEAWFESGSANAGMLTANYLAYQGATLQPRLSLSRSFIAPPDQPFFVVRYALTNPTGASITFNVLDQVHLNTVDSSKPTHAWYDSANNALLADMTASGQFFMVLGALQPMDGYQAANDSDWSSSSPTASPWYTFDATGALKNNADVSTGNVSLAFNKRVVVAPGATATLYFYLGIAQTQAEATAAIAAARASSGDAWVATTAAAYTSWLSNGGRGRSVNFADNALNQVFNCALILIKNVQNPVLGTFAATTNPLAYGYKTWVRDASSTAIALDASGHFAEAELYWRWMASCQDDDGTWKTTYDTWNGSYVPFVEPEYDSIGAFMVGVYHHVVLTADTQFLGDLWPNVKKSADWILSNIQANGFGQADYSIWEEETNLEHNSYTQSWYVAGLYAAQALAERQGDTSLTEWYAGGPASILSALQRPSNWTPAGTWNPAGYYNRAVNVDSTPRTLVDSSSDMLIASGVIDHESGRAASHIATILSTLTKGSYGLARYPGDTFYYTGAWSPGGNEALGPEPSWPQMSVWVAVYQILCGQQAVALPRMQWCASVFGKGYMPSGEAVSNVTGQPLLSSMSEPLTASAFILAALLYEGQYAFAVTPPLYNAGTSKTMQVSFGTSGDWGQWSNVPYFLGAQSTAGASPMCMVKRVYVANDDTNMYLRVDNVSGGFPAFQQQPFFAVHVYSQDLAGGNGASSNLGVYGQPLSRAMTFMVERRSDIDAYPRWKVSGGGWVADQAVAGVIEPQWDVSTGRLEAVIPMWALSSGNVVFGGWVDLLVVMVSYDANTSVWTEGDRLLLHYRVSTGEQQWIYGNIEQ
jgi:GH15 family glucan-1,4-alpha-glucosidase